MRHALKGLAWMLLALLPHWAEAHRLDEVVQGAYLTLAPGEVRLELDLTPGIEVSGALLQALDADADGTITKAEAQGYAQRVLAQSTLALDGVTVSWTLGDVNVPPYKNLQVGSDTIRIYATSERPDSPGAHVLGYRNDHQPAASRRMANVFLQPGEGWQYRVTGQQRSDDGRQLTVTYTVARR
jgi:hypothetical protein